jgi:hypothetical protein
MRDYSEAFVAFDTCKSRANAVTIAEGGRAESGQAGEEVGEALVDIARTYGVSHSTISHLQI